MWTALEEKEGVKMFSASCHALKSIENGEELTIVPILLLTSASSQSIFMETWRTVLELWIWSSNIDKYSTVLCWCFYCSIWDLFVSTACVCFQVNVSLHPHTHPAGWAYWLVEFREMYGRSFQRLPGLTDNLESICSSSVTSNIVVQ